MRNVFKWLATSLVWSQCATAAVPNDFDGDGTSDRTWVEVASDKTLTWKSESSVSKMTSTIATLGSEGDVPVMAQWIAGGSQIGVASINGTTGDIVWTIRDSTGNLSSKTFGKKGDLIVSGADLNGNGLADAAVVRLVRGKVEWDVAFDLFASTLLDEKTLSFGKTGDRVFYARVVDGTATDWIGLMRKGSRRRSSARMRDFVTGEVRTFSRLPQFASQGSRPRAFPIRQASGPDLLGFSVPSGTTTTIKVFAFDGTPYASTSIAGTGTTVVGEFLQDTGYEVLFQSKEDSVFFSPHSIGVTQTVGVGGTLVGEFNINVLGETVNSTPTNGGGTSGGGSVSSCSEIVPWPSGHIYKTIGSEHFSDIRRNTVGIVLKQGARGPYPSCVDAVDKDGRVVAKLGLYEKGNGWAARYYAGIRCGTSTPFNGNAVAARAREGSGSSQIYMNFGSVCYGPIDASQCIGSKQC